MLHKEFENLAYEVIKKVLEDGFGVHPRSLTPNDNFLVKCDWEPHEMSHIMEEVASQYNVPVPSITVSMGLYTALKIAEYIIANRKNV